MIRNQKLSAALVGFLVLLTVSCGFKRKKYDNPITKDTKQPDKVLYDRAINDVEHSRYEVARITLNTLINTYDQSEFMAKAKLAIADSWFREGGTQGFAQAEHELGARYYLEAEAIEVVVLKLAVDEVEVPRGQAIGQRDEGDLAGVVGAREHGLAKEAAA